MGTQVPYRVNQHQYHWRSSIETAIAAALIGAAITMFGMLVTNRLSVWREDRTIYRAAAAKLRGAFGPALARLENARLHGSTHDTPDVDGLLQNQFEAFAAAVEEFSHFVGFFRRRGYQKAWQQYCEVAHAGTVSPVFMASALNEGSPYLVLEKLIYAVLSFAKT